MLLQLSDIAYSWPGQTRPTLLLDEFSLEARQQTLLFGPSGCGKSSLLSIISGIVTPQKGQVRLLGHDLASLSLGKRDSLRADHIGYVFQQFNLLPYLSVLENVMLGCRFSPLRRTRAIARSGSVRDDAQRLLRHLKLPEALFEESARHLSIGQQQRVAVARALIGSPELIIADEPTSSLDEANREAFVELLLAELNLNDSALLMVSHDRSLQAHFSHSVSLPEINQGGAHA